MVIDLVAYRRKNFKKLSS